MMQAAGTHAELTSAAPIQLKRQASMLQTDGSWEANGPGIADVQYEELHQQCDRLDIQLLLSQFTLLLQQVDR